MNSISINGNTFQTAQSYNELPKTQLLKICRVLLWPDKFESYRLLTILLGIKKAFVFKSKAQKALEALPPSYITYLALNDEITGFIKQPAKLTNYTIPNFIYRGRKYYGPHDDLLNIEVAEWFEAAMYYTRYKETVADGNPENDLIDKIIAVLYRPGKWFYNLRKISADFNIDRRQINNEYRFNKRSKRFSKLAPELKFAIFLQYEGQMEAFSKSFENAFESSGGSSASYNAWIKLLMAMSNDIFGDYEKTQKTNAFAFFTKVDQNIAQSKEQEDRIKKARKSK